MNFYRCAEIAAAGLKFSFRPDHIGQDNGPTLAQALTELVDETKTDVVLIIDEVQHAISTEEGNQLMLALKAARDAINPRPGTPGHFVFIGTGSHRALVSELTARRNQAFAGATSIAYPLLGQDYVEHLLARLHADGVAPLPSVDTAFAAFGMLGHCPEEMLRALRQMLQLAEQGTPDTLLPVIAATLRSTAADIELLKVDQLGGLAREIFARIANAGGEASGLFSGEATAAYAAALGRVVRTEDVQPVINELLAANLIMRRSHGAYCLTDPFVQQIWQERAALPGLAGAHRPTGPGTSLSAGSGAS